MFEMKLRDLSPGDTFTFTPNARASYQVVQQGLNRKIVAEGQNGRKMFSIQTARFILRREDS